MRQSLHILFLDEFGLSSFRRVHLSALLIEQQIGLIRLDQVHWIFLDQFALELAILLVVRQIGGGHSGYFCQKICNNKFGHEN
jgi:hypothetical protein